MKRIIGLLLNMLMIMHINAQTYVINTSKSKIEWIGEKVTGSHNGTIDLKKGEFIMKKNKIVSGIFGVDMKSIANIDLTDETWNKKLVDHLKSDDFFSVEKFPESVFRITESGDFSDGSDLVKGDLTIKGITHPIEFIAEIKKNGEELKISARVVIDRSKYDVRYGSGSFFENLGDKTIYDEFVLKINLFAEKQ